MKEKIIKTLEKQLELLSELSQSSVTPDSLGILTSSMIQVSMLLDTLAAVNRQ